jgi:hypothetical protein
MRCVTKDIQRLTKDIGRVTKDIRRATHRLQRRKDRRRGVTLLESLPLKERP